MSNPMPPQQPYYPRQPPGRKRKIWPWILVAAVILPFGGCLAVVGTATKEAGEALDAAASSINRPPASTAGQPVDNATPPPLVPKPQTSGKTVVYEIISDAGELNSVTYYDEMSDLKQEASASAPWTKTVVNTSTYAIVDWARRRQGLPSPAESPLMVW